MIYTVVRDVCWHEALIARRACFDVIARRHCTSPVSMTPFRALFVAEVHQDGVGAFNLYIHTCILVMWP